MRKWRRHHDYGLLTSTLSRRLSIPAATSNKQQLRAGPVTYSQALARDESYWPAWYGLGQVKSAQGKYTDAVEAFDRWLEGVEKGDDDRRSGSNAPGVKKSGRVGATDIAKGLVQLGKAYMKLGQVRGA